MPTIVARGLIIDIRNYPGEFVDAEALDECGILAKARWLTGENLLASCCLLLR